MAGIDHDDVAVRAFRPEIGGIRGDVRYRRRRIRRFGRGRFRLRRPGLRRCLARSFRGRERRFGRGGRLRLRLIPRRRSLVRARGYGRIRADDRQRRRFRRRGLRTAGTASRSHDKQRCTQAAQNISHHRSHASFLSFSMTRFMSSGMSAVNSRYSPVFGWMKPMTAA